MTQLILEKIARYIYLPQFKKVEHQIGYKLILRDIPSSYINGWVTVDMTQTWRRFGLDVIRGANYFTIGSIVNADSSRFDPNSLEYESWLGGYTLKLASTKPWTVEDHFKLAIADQNSWLRWYGNPKPTTTIKGWKFAEAGNIQLGQYSGHLYDGGCTTLSDVGAGYNTLRLKLVCAWLAALFNLSNPSLKLKARELRPKTFGKRYEKLKLHGYIAIFDLPRNVKVVLYGNGFVDERKHSDTFLALKASLIKAMKSCEIIKA